MMSSDAGIYIFDCLPGVTSLCIEQKFVGNSFCFFAQPCCFGAFDNISKEFSAVSKFVFQGTAGWVFGAFIVCFVSVFDCFEEFGFIFREPVRTLSFSSWLEVKSCFFYDFGEDVKGLPFRFGFQEEGIDGFSEIDPFLWARKKFPLESLFVLYLLGS
jgi:hypothetical protein